MYGNDNWQRVICTIKAHTSASFLPLHHSPHFFPRILYCHEWMTQFQASPTGRAGLPGLEESGPWPSPGRATEPVDWSTGWVGPGLGISKPVGPQAGRAWLVGLAGWAAGWGKNLNNFQFWREGDLNPFPYGTTRELAINWVGHFLCNYFALVIYILEMLYDFFIK